jgi:tetratricopeptide (TPR) repeat protein
MKVKNLLAVILALGTITISTKALGQDFFTAQTQFPGFTSSGSNSNLLRCLPATNPQGYLQSVKYFTQLIKILPNDPCAYFHRASSHFTEGNFKAAKADFDKVIELDPSIAYAYLGRGSCFIVLNSPISALSDLKKASYLFQEEGEKEMVDMINSLIRMIELIIQLEQ